MFNSDASDVARRGTRSPVASLGSSISVHVPVPGRPRSRSPTRTRRLQPWYGELLPIFLLSSSFKSAERETHELHVAVFRPRLAVYEMRRVEFGSNKLQEVQRKP